MALLRAWALGFCPLNTIERTLTDLIDGRGSDAVVRDEALYIYKQWLRVYMRSKMIKHNKDLLESIDDRTALLSQLHIY
jgi:hypothetical protein